VTTPGIDPGTVRLVAQRLNHYATPGSANIQVQNIFHEITLHVTQIVNTEQLKLYIPKKIVCFRYITVNTPYKGDKRVIIIIMMIKCILLQLNKTKVPDLHSIT